MTVKTERFDALACFALPTYARAATPLRGFF
jgi:hypothetical protein